METKLLDYKEPFSAVTKPDRRWDNLDPNNIIPIPANDDFEGDSAITEISMDGCVAVRKVLSGNSRSGGILLDFFRDFYKVEWIGGEDPHQVRLTRTKSLWVPENELSDGEYSKIYEVY